MNTFEPLFVIVGIAVSLITLIAALKVYALTRSSSGIIFLGTLLRNAALRTIQIMSMALLLALVLRGAGVPTVLMTMLVLSVLCIPYRTK